MKKIVIVLVLIISSVSFQSCFEDFDDTIGNATTLEIQDFIYKAMNIWYLYKPDVPDLANDRFENQAELNDFLESYTSPEDLFNALVAPQDRFSFVVEDYRELEASLAGIFLSNGMEYGLIFYPGSQTNVFGYIRYVIPNSDAAQKGLERGMIFNTVNGAQITNQNFQLLRELTNYEIGLATFDGTEVTPTGETVNLIKSELVENPIHTATTLTIEGQKIGYLMYNSFTADFDSQLNNAFGTFLSEGISELVLDLRYNSGGSIRSAIDLSSMITGQFTGQVFSTEVWNPELQQIFEQNEPEDLINRFSSNLRTGEAINSLNLNRVYILTSTSTASASELVINGLDPYIEVIQVGTTTTGKFQASTTFYDGPAPNFRRDEANPGHFYAIQPLIFTSANANGVTGFVDGLPPTVEFFEDYSNLGILGNPTEPLLDEALDDIFGRSIQRSFQTEFKEAGNSKSHLPTYMRMYVEEIDKN
ncbi:S41 family peptidase [Planktosalinus lacus]|uniref:Peptidase S41 n=1 Tax=Planktosalinus lacus TaxID=1526573 RepID=A0A8J2VBG0_9FLAO|nr:S41 family peptidase [Planktosalinus lacus]GGD99304.1 peptidase S41 [Planktosalinus lacus]